MHLIHLTYQTSWLNRFPPRLLDNKVLNISYNLNTLLKLTNRMVANYSNCLAYRELQRLPLPHITRECQTISIAQEKIKTQKSEVQFPLNVDCCHIIVKLKNQESNHCKSGMICMFLVLELSLTLTMQFIVQVKFTLNLILMWDLTLTFTLIQILVVFQYILQTISTSDCELNWI